jgi:hypothetical protein
MFRFIKENSYIIVKLMLNQFGINVLGIMLYLVTQNNETLVLITSFFAVFMYMFLLHTVAWEEGAKYGIRVTGGRADPMPLGGLWLSICANVVNLIVAVIVAIGYYTAEGGVLHTIGKAVGYLTEGMYMGLIALYSPFNPIGWFLIIIPAVIITTLSYWLGTKQFGLRSLFKLQPPSGKNSKK